MLKSDLVSDNVLKRIQAVAWIELGQEVEVRGLEVSLIPIGLEVRGLALTDQHHPEPWLRVDAVDVSFGWNFQTGTPKIRFASVRDVVFARMPTMNRRGQNARQPAAGPETQTPSSSPPGKSPSLSLPALGEYVDYAEFLNLKILLELPGNNLRIEDFDLLARATSPTSWQLGLKASRVSSNGHFDVQDASLNGSSFLTLSPEEFNIALSGLTLRTLANELELQGQWSLLEGAPSDNRLQVKLSGEIETLQAMVPSLEADGWQGTLTLDAEVAGHWSSPAYAWTLDVQEFVSPKYPLGTLALSGSGNLDQLNLDRIFLEGDAGRIEGALSFEFESQQLSSQLRTEKLQVGSVLELLDAPQAIIGPFSGEIAGTGALSPLDLEITVAGFFDRLEINDGAGLEIVRINQLSSTIKANVTPSFLNIKQARFSQSNLEIETFGDILYDGPTRLNLTSNVKRINLQPLSPIVGLTFSGVGQAAISVDGPADGFTVSGSTHLKEFGIEGLKFGTIRSALLFKENNLELPNVTLLRNEGIARGKVIVDILEPALESKLSFEEIDINALLADLQLAPALLPYVKGLATGDISLQGPIDKLGLTLSAQGKDLVFDPLYLPSAHIEAVRETGDTSPIIFGVVAGDKDEHTINVEIASNDRLEIDLELKEYPFEYLIAPALRNRSGNLDLTVDLDGPINSLMGNVSLSTKACQVDNIDLGNGQGALQFESGNFQGNLSFPAQSIVVNASGQVGEQIPISTTIQFSDLTPLRWADPQTDIGLVTTGSVFIQGDLTNLPAMTADANLTSASLNWSGISGTLERPAVISYAEEKFRVAELDMNLDGLLVSAMGEVPIQGSRSLQLRVLGNAGGLSPLFGSIEKLEGDLDGFIDVSGELAEPQFSGTVSMRDLSGREPTLGLSFTEGLGRVTFIDRDILIDSATMKTGDGSVNVLGKVTILPEFKPQLQLTLNQTRLKPYPQSEAIVSGELQVTQPNGILVSGALEVNRATYGESVDLSRLFVRQPNMTFGTNIEEEPWDLRVQLSAPKGIFVSNNMVEAELRADLTVRGNTKRMGLIGSVVPLSGTVSYGGNEFEVESGSFDFTDEYAIRPNYATKLRADACGMDLQVNLSGESERFIVEASGEDETGVVDARDALLCAQFGIRSAEPNLSADQQGSGLKDSLPGAVDALWRVSGMDERVRRYIPVVDEFKLTSGYSRSSKQTEPRLLVIKELGRQWELKYNGPVNESDEQHVLGLEYRLKRGLVLEGSWVSVSEATAGDLGIDLRMDWEFD